MAGVYGKLLIEAAFSLSGVQRGTSVPVHQALINFAQAFDPGAGALGKADLMYHEVLNIAASGSFDIDLAGLLKDPLGTTFTDAEVMLMLFNAPASNVNNVIIGNAASNGFVGPFGAAAHTVKLEPGNCHVFTSLQGYPVTAGTGDLLHLANSGAGSAVNVEALVIGRSVVG